MQGSDNPWEEVYGMYFDLQLVAEGKQKTKVELKSAEKSQQQQRYVCFAKTVYTPPSMRQLFKTTTEVGTLIQKLREKLTSVKRDTKALQELKHHVSELETDSARQEAQKKVDEAQTALGEMQIELDGIKNAAEAFLRRNASAYNESCQILKHSAGSG